MKAYTKYGAYALNTKAGILVVNGDSVSLESRRDFGSLEDWHQTPAYDFFSAYNSAISRFGGQIAEAVRDAEIDAEIEEEATLTLQ